MHPAIAALREGRRVDRPMWQSLWDDLRAGRLTAGEAAHVLDLLPRPTLDGPSAADLLHCLGERRPPASVGHPDAVNIVGTGGGPPTFNISTAAALVAAATGIWVIKTGGRAHTSRYGSFDLLDRLGVPLTSSDQETREMLDRRGVAFAGSHVYPEEMLLLARAAFPIDLHKTRRFFNTLGPFVAAAPVDAQLTGISEHHLLPLFKRLGAALPNRRVWLCTNDLGADELLGFGGDTIHPVDGSSAFRPGIPAPGGPEPDEPLSGPLRDEGLDGLRPVPEGADVTGHFLSVLSGQADERAIRAVCLNAAAMQVVLSPATDWGSAFARAREAMCSGAAVALVERLQADAVRSRSGGLTVGGTRRG